jgi:ADP-heptose:LPS heptosyltransferase
MEGVGSMPQLSRRIAARLIARAGLASPPVQGPGPVQLLIDRANAARDEARTAAAAQLYAEALQLDPSLGPIHVQAGHMFKESGDLDAAERHYVEALRLMPDDGDLALQLGHFYKLQGRLTEAQASYERAERLGSPFAGAELQHLHRSGLRPTKAVEPVRTPGAVLRADDLGPKPAPDSLELATLYGHLAPELAPRPEHELLRYQEEQIAIRQIGVGQRTHWGFKAVVRGVEAIRGVVVSQYAATELQAFINGLLIYRAPLKGPYELEFEPQKERLYKYVFNIWHDFSNLLAGHYRLDLTVKIAGQPDRSHATWFVVEPPLREAQHPESDALIDPPADAEGSLEDAILARPSVVREAWRPNQLGSIDSILVTRTDQLGDLVASIPALYRLRELFPDARIVGMLGPSNVGLAKSLNVFDDVLVVDHRESWHQRTRALPMPVQQEIRDLCAPYRFDLAIDLALSNMGRPLLALSGARLLYGFKDESWRRLSITYDDEFLDEKNKREAGAHSKRVLGLVERLGLIHRVAGRVIRREDLSRDQLQCYGLQRDDRFAVLHTGARVVWTRWRHYADLASKLLNETDLKVVVFSEPEDTARYQALAAESDGRLIVISGLLPFDDFDAFISFSSIYVGNDSGPKHLASLRGVPVVSIHCSRINWSEWGQELTGVIISRKVPCAGCNLYHDPEECGRDYICMDIKLDEVYEAVRRYV